jgi:hypothetical protein
MPSTFSLDYPLLSATLNLDAIISVSQKISLTSHDQKFRQRLNKSSFPKKEVMK